MKFTGERFIPVEALLGDEIAYEHLHRYYAVQTLVRNKEVLDLACGEGYGSAIIAQSAARVTGMDIDAETIRVATAKYTATHGNLHFSYASADAIPAPDAAFDVVISFETIEHLDGETQQRFLQEIKRVLRPSGLLIMSTPDKKNYADRYEHKNPFHLREFYREEFSAFIKAYFTYTVFFEQGYEVVGLIANAETGQADAIKQVSWKENDQAPAERKYIIAVASNAPLPADVNAVSSIVTGVDKDYLSLMDRLITMNKEIEALGKWGKTLDSEIQLQSAASAHMAETTAGVLQQKDEEIHRAQEELKQLHQQLSEKELQTAALQQKLHQLYQEVNSTKEKLADIYDSDGWRLLSKYYRLKGKLLPENSARYKRFKKIYNLLRSKPGVKMNTAGNGEAQALPAARPRVDFEPLVLPAHAFPLVSIIIPAYNAWEMNYECISSIIAHTTGIAYEVLLADDCSTDGTRTCTSLISNLVHVRNEENLGFLKNCNHAAALAKGNYILFLNNDTTVRPGWLAQMAGLMERDETIGMVGAKLIYPDGSLQEAGGIIWQDASGWNYGNRQDPQSPEFNYVKEADYVSGACILIRKKAWLEAGGFDERYSPAYCEDSDLAFTLRSIGYKVMYQPLAEVIHYEGYSHGTDHTLTEKPGSVKSYQEINNKKFFAKWEPVLTKQQLPNAQNVFQARDRTTGKKTMLVIDHYVPHFDKDAGSKTTLQYLQLFSLLGLNIKFIGDNFFKHEPYTTALQQMGIEVLYGPAYRDNWQQWIKDNGAHIDYVYLNRPHISIKYIDFLKKFTAARILYYGHDLHFHREAMQYEVEQDPKLLKSAAKWRETELYLFENTDIILTPSNDENTIIRALNPAFRVETILPYFFTKPAVPVTDFSGRGDILFVGGFAHAPNLDAVVWFCQEVWPHVSRELPGIKFIVVGSNPPDAVKNLQSDSIEIRGYISETDLQLLYGKVKLVVVPLRYGAGVKGKTVEAMHYGLPIVSTSFGTEGMPGNHRAFLHPVNLPDAFAAEITRLYQNDDLLRSLSREETDYINQHFSQESAAVKMKDLLNLNG